MRREKHRDDRDYDTTQLHQSLHGKSLHRDYTAHFFRWSFARRFVKPSDHVLEVGCGQDKPLSKILLRGAAPRCSTYVGVDLNKVKPSDAHNQTFIGEFNFVERWKELLKLSPKGRGFDVAVHLEVIEHMRVNLGARMLKACHAALKPGGVMLMSTPVYDGVRHAANHIHEYTVPELQKATEKAGFKIVRRFGTFMDIKHVGRAPPAKAELDRAVAMVRSALAEYFDNDAISNIFGPLYPDHARNNLWVCRKEAR